jgi:starvation-inducible outer membrane lipoprotein
MKPHTLCCAMLLTLAACASHPPLCEGRLTPINRQTVQSRATAGTPSMAPRASKAGPK